MKKTDLLYCFMLLVLTISFGFKINVIDSNNEWKNKALEYNNYVFNNCKYEQTRCNEYYQLGVNNIEFFEHNKARKKIFNNILENNNVNKIVIEECGSGESYYYDVYVIDLVDSTKNLKYYYDLKTKEIAKIECQYLKPVYIVNFVTNLDYVRLQNSNNWKNYSRSIGLNFVSYTLIKSGKIEFVKFISKPIVQATINY